MACRRATSFLFFGLLAALTSASTLAHAQATPTPPGGGGDATGTIDIVVLRSGAMIRGRVAEVVPEDHVLLIKESGESLRISWAEIDRVTLGWDRAAPLPASPSMRPGSDGAILVTPNAPPPMVGPLARVHLDAPHTVSLYRRPAGSETWVHACTAPCDIELPINDDYRAQGTDVKRSDAFRLNVVNNQAVVRVDPSSLGGAVMGGVLATVGGITALVGLLVIPEKKTRTGGAVAVAIGAALLVGGFFIYKSSSKTDVTLGGVTPPKAATTAAPIAFGDLRLDSSLRSSIVLDAYVREPAWQTAFTAAGLDPSTERALPSGSLPAVFSRSF